MDLGKRCVFVGAWLALVVGSIGANAAPAATSRSVSAPVELPFEEVARRFSAWIERERAPGEIPAAGELERVLREELVWIELGLFEVGLPERAFEREAGLEAFRRACGALVAAQGRWLEWRGLSGGPKSPSGGPKSPSGSAKSETARDLALLSEWIEDWNPGRLAAAGASPKRHAIGLPAGDEELHAAAARVAALMRGEGPAVRLALMPERASFVEFLCFCGWVRPDLRRHFWVAGIEQWTHFFVDDIQVYALEYSAVGSAGDYRLATPMDARTPTGLEQHVVALAANKLLDRAYGEALPASFITGLGNELVIDLYDAVDTRVDGDLSERQTSAREVFVPGGASEGGTLPPLDADSPWRQDQGRYHFARVLRRAQKRAAKAKDAGGTPSRNKLANFVLRGEGERGEWVVSAPFLGSQAGDELPTSSFRGDYVEFLRAYQIAFVHWLRTEAGGSERKSQAAFTGLLERLAQTEAGNFVEAVEASYELPLSDGEAGKRTLEGRFLRWLSKQRSS